MKKILLVLALFLGTIQPLHAENMNPMSEEEMHEWVRGELDRGRQVAGSAWGDEIHCNFRLKRYHELDVTTPDAYTNLFLTISREEYAADLEKYCPTTETNAAATQSTSEVAPVTKPIPSAPMEPQVAPSQYSAPMETQTAPSYNTAPIETPVMPTVTESELHTAAPVESPFPYLPVLGAAVLALAVGFAIGKHMQNKQAETTDIPSQQL